MAENILHSGSFVDRSGNEISITFYKKSAHSVMTVEPTSLSFGSAAQTIRLKVYNSSGTLNVTKSAGATWLSYSGGSASGYKYYDVTVTANSNSYIRTAVLSLTDNYNTVTVNVSQAALISSISVTPNELSFNSNGETKNAIVTWEGGSTPTYSFSGSTPTWMSITNSVSGNQMTITVNAGPNTSGSTRTATMIITNSISTCTLEMSQGTVHQVSVSPSEFLNMAAAGESRTLTVSNIQGQVQVSYSGDGLSLGNPYISGQIAMYTVTYAANTVAAARTGQIKVKDTNSDWVIIPTSQLASSAAFAVSPTSFEYAGSGSTNTFTFTGVPAGGMSYSIPAAAEDWVTISNFSNSSVDITTSANPYVTSRTTTVTFYDQDDPSNYVTVTVNQAAGQSSLTVSPTSITYMPSGGTYGVDVTWTAGNTPTATITYVQGAGGWLTQHSTTPSGGSMSFAWTATSNYDSSSRTALISITNGLQTEQVTVSQSSAPSPAVFSVTPTTITRDYAGGTTYVTFSNPPTIIDYSISSASGNDWISVTNITQRGASVVVGNNSGSSSRTASVIFVDDSDPTNYVTVSVTQEGNVTPALSVQTVNMSFAAAGERKDNVVTNIVGTLTHTEPSWITISESGSGGSRLVGVTAASNSSTADRSGSLVFDDDRNVPVTVALTQEGYYPDMSVTPSELNFRYDTTTWKDLYITNVSGRLTNLSCTASWVRLSQYIDDSYHSISVTPSKNTGSSERTGTITATDTRGQTISVPIKQARGVITATVSELHFDGTGVPAQSYLVYTPLKSTHSGTGDPTSYNVNGYYINNSVSTSFTSDSLYCVDTVSVSCNSNSFNTSRSGYIIQTALSLNQRTVYIYQDAHTPILSASPSQFNFSSADQSARLDVYYEGTLVTNGTGNFITLSEDSGQSTSGHKVYSVSVTSNTVYASRSGSLEFEDDYDTIAVPVTQDPGEPILLVTPNRMDFPATLSYSLATVTYPSTLSVSVSIEYNTADTGWINVELAAQVSGDTRTYTIDVDPNDGPNSGQEREAMIAFEGELGGADEIYVYQRGQN